MFFKKRAAQQAARDTAGMRSAACEQLEDRTLFAVNLVVDADGNKGLQITGTSLNDNIVVQIAGNQTTVVGSANPSASPLLTFKGIQFFDITTGSGNDTVSITSNAAGQANRDKSFEADLGAGNDQITYNGPDVSNTNLDFDFSGGTGNDTIGITLNNIDANSSVFAHLEGNADVDALNVTVNDVTGGDLDVDINTGDGVTNTVTTSVNAINNTATVAYTVKGGVGAETVTNNFTGAVTSSTIDLDNYLGAGNDTATVGLIGGAGGFSVTGGNARFNLQGQDNNDSLLVRTDHSLSLNAAVALDLNLAGGFGDDTVAVDLAPLGGTVTLSGQKALKIRQSGGAGNDRLVSRLPLSFVGGGQADINITGESGNDVADFNIVQTGAVATSFTGGRILVDGGSGTDTKAPGFTIGAGVPVVFLRFDPPISVTPA